MLFLLACALRGRAGQRNSNTNSCPMRRLPAPEGRGGTWNRDGVIVFAPSPVANLYRIAATGGTPAAVTKLGTARKSSAIDAYRCNEYRWEV
jgi:hypothetical protein